AGRRCRHACPSGMPGKHVTVAEGLTLSALSTHVLLIDHLLRWQPIANFLLRSLLLRPTTSSAPALRQPGSLPGYGTVRALESRGPAPATKNGRRVIFFVRG